MEGEKGEKRYNFPSFVTMAHNGGEWSSTSLSCIITEEKVPSIHWIGGWIDPKAGIHSVINYAIKVVWEIVTNISDIVLHVSDKIILWSDGSTLLIQLEEDEI